MAFIEVDNGRAVGPFLFEIVAFDLHCISQTHMSEDGQCGETTVSF